MLIISKSVLARIISVHERSHCFDRIYNPARLKTILVLHQPLTTTFAPLVVASYLVNRI